MGKKDNRRYDSKRRLLRKCEYEKADRNYLYRWTVSQGKRHSISATTLEELRKKEEEIRVNVHDGIRAEAASTTLNDIYKLWCNMKRGLKDNTFQNYKYMYEMFVAPSLGQMKIQTLKRSDVKRFYNKLVDERGLKINTTDSVHTVLHQVLQIAVEDGYIRNNIQITSLRN